MKTGSRSGSGRRAQFSKKEEGLGDCVGVLAAIRRKTTLPSFRVDVLPPSAEKRRKEDTFSDILHTELGA